MNQKCIVFGVLIIIKILKVQSTNYATYKNPVAAGAEFLHAIATVMEESVLGEVCKSPSWSLLIDGSNTITHDKSCAVVSKYMAGNIPVLHYLGLIELLETDAKFFYRKNVKYGWFS